MSITDSCNKMPKDPIFKGVGNQIEEIPLSSIQAVDGVSLTRADMSVLTSYNILEKRLKTIVVPGR